MVGQVLERLAMKQMFVISPGHAIADPSRQQQAKYDCLSVDRLAGKLPQRCDDFRDEVAFKLAWI
jgi:hypothetical protein